MSSFDKNHLTDTFHFVRDKKAFAEAVQGALDQVERGRVFLGDNLITFGKCLSFLDDERFMGAVEAHAKDPVERGILWRTYTLCWAARRALALEGDFVECGTYKGTSARILVDYLDFSTTGKRLFLYDVFVQLERLSHLTLPALGVDLHEAVCDRFRPFANVSVIKGEVPGSLLGTAPERIAFLHIDMNDAAAEVGALEALFGRVVPGGSILLDDYGWQFYRRQKDAEDPFFAARGYQVLELPTGQGLVIK